MKLIEIKNTAFYLHKIRIEKDREILVLIHSLHLNQKKIIVNTIVKIVKEMILVVEDWRNNKSLDKLTI